ncbi:MAG: M1 family metallopeptidase [Saprospiraceae bacterium]|nr:M1 family metallopeptidase [Saprospiraceae bacterium]HMW38257.1 M1 family metallopeptidase [Saprospiraceae bacterium]HMX88558.1 M1 family metallopeptidase [Saprospiraceae bacterium]HMZ40545.1 M1 family metallopeptidase [Saprospiraceae bacterium]HNB29950.1 M1 family metallopeptidase [Saprospiraceae bacterium]
MEKLFQILSIVLLIGKSGLAQPDYFQQRIDFKINVVLNDEINKLDGQIEMTYHNNSPDALDRLGFHLYPNAYINNKTAFAKQKLLNRDTKFYAAQEQDRGWLKMSKITVDGKEVYLEPVKNNPDMAWMKLPQVLLPGQSITIKGSFDLKIPNSYSRLGHVGNTYQITQWYLKPAVYDKTGWHVFPYLDQGEFYSDFGNYHVEINIPSNYVVAATGMLQDSAEWTFLEEKIIETQEALKNNKNSLVVKKTDNRKTLHFVAENVHDFAWFADKAFMVSREECTLPSGKKINAWVYFNTGKYWPEGAHFASRAVKFYSEVLGEYSWPQVSVVHSALSAGGGMEYPMITVINDVGSSRELDQVITHEVGHNWLQGALATNERDHPWMDEGINTYYEKRYMDKYYDNHFLFGDRLEKFYKRLSIGSETELFYQISNHLNLDQFPEQTSERFNFLNYGTDVYWKTGALFRYAESYLGLSRMDSIMKDYYSVWSFKHPYPEDLHAIFRKHVNDRADWLFELLSSNEKTDYSIKKIKQESDQYRITLQSDGHIKAPVMLSAISNSREVYSTWVDGFDKIKTIDVKKDDIDYFILDKDGQYFDYNMKGNYFRTKGIFKKCPPVRLGIKALYNSKYYSGILAYPSIFWNRYDGLMAGMTFRSPILPRNNWLWSLSPKYAFNTARITGSGALNYRINLNKGALDFVKIGLNVKHYSYQRGFQDYFNQYYQAEPFLAIQFRTSLTKLTTSKLKFSVFSIIDNVRNEDPQSGKVTIVKERYFIPKISYYYSNPSIISPHAFNASIYYEKYKTIQDQQAQYVRTDLEFRNDWRLSRKRYFSARWAMSFFPVNTERDRQSAAVRTDQHFIRGTAGSAFQGYHDYTNEYNFLGRSATTGLWSQQIEIVQGGMKIAPGLAQRNNLGNTNKFLVAMNISSDIPVKWVGRIFRPYFDVVYLEPVSSGEKSKWLYSGGIGLNIVPKFFEIYLPIINSINITEIYKSENRPYLKQICFSLKLNFEHIRDIANFVQ